MMFDFTSVRYPEQSDSQRWRAEGCSQEGGGDGSGESVFHVYRVSVLQEEKCSGDGWRSWLHNNVKILNAAELKNGSTGKSFPT